MTEKEGKTMKNSTTCYFLHHFIKSVTPKSGQKLMQMGQILLFQHHVAKNILSIN
nr:hypothetical protein [uncultured Alloprevotella sp.]